MHVFVCARTCVFVHHQVLWNDTDLEFTRVGIIIIIIVVVVVVVVIRC